MPNVSIRRKTSQNCFFLVIEIITSDLHLPFPVLLFFRIESTQKTIDVFRIHYNFVREHSAIGKTPAEEAGIKLDLGQNIIESLIKFASKITN